MKTEFTGLDKLFCLAMSFQSLLLNKFQQSDIMYRSCLVQNMNRITAVTHKNIWCSL